MATMKEIMESVRASKGYKDKLARVAHRAADRMAKGSTRPQDSTKKDQLND